MSIDKKTVEYVARLGRIELSPIELEKLSGQLEHILAFIDKLNQADTAQVEPTSHILPLKNVLREDIPQKSLSPEQALANAPAKEGSFFVVPRIIE